MGWQKIDITSTIRQWYTEDNGSDNLHLLIDCSGCDNRIDIHLFNNKNDEKNLLHHKHNHILNSFNNDNNYNKNEHHEYMDNKQSKQQQQQNQIIDSYRPFLVVHTDPNIMKRVRRRALDCSGALKGQCCKQRFYVSFKALGWDDWIIAPPGYFANYCRGDCGGLHRTPDMILTYYTHVIEEFRKLDKLNGMQPCCAPLKFSSMSLIYFGPDSKIIKRDLPKMVVDECGCP